MSYIDEQTKEEVSRLNVLADQLERYIAYLENIVKEKKEVIKLSVESIEKTPSIKVLQNIDKIKKGIGTIKELILETYDLLINDQWSPNDANNYIKANCGLNPRTVERALPDIAKDESKQHAGTKPVFKDSGDTSRQNSYIEEPKNAEEKIKLPKEHKVVDIKPVEETPIEYTPNLGYEERKFSLQNFKEAADDVNVIYFENKTYDQIRALLSDLRFRNDKFDSIFQRRTK